MEYWSLLYGVHYLFFTLLPWWKLNRVSNPMYVSSLNIRYTPNKFHATIYRKFPGCRYIRQGQHQWLTHWGRDKIAAIFQTTFLKWIFMDEGVWISIEMSLTFIPKGPVNNIPALVQIMAWRRPSDNHCLNEWVQSVTRGMIMIRNGFNLMSSYYWGFKFVVRYLIQEW